MLKLTIIATVAYAALAERIPLRKQELTMENLIAYEHQLLLGAPSKFLSAGLDDQVPVKDYMNTPYFVDVQVGTPAQTFTVIPDTGSSNLWIYSSTCTNVVCQYHDTYDGSKSKSYKKVGTDFQISYGSGDISGFESEDVAVLGGATSTMGFGEISKVKGVAFYASQMSGILGFAYNSISVNGLKTFVDLSDLTDKSFAFYLNLDTEKSYMTIPGYDESAMINQEFQFHDVVEKKYFSLNLTGLKQGTTAIDSGRYKAVIDSGTSVLVGPKKLVDQLNNGITVKKTCLGIENLPDITFQIDGIDYVLTYNDYVLKVTQNGVTECQNSIMASNFPVGFDYFILGDTFMRKYYSYFDMNNDRVGFINSSKLTPTF